MNLPSTRSLGLSLIFISLLPLSNSVQHYSSRQTFVDNSFSRLATVIEQQATRRSTGQEVRSLVEYLDDNGSAHHALSNVSSYPAPHAIGEQINILVNRNDPQDIRVDSFTGTWLEIAFYLIPGLLAFTGGLFMLARSRRR